ncbi:MAG: hypothetical protein BroJett040_19540 [Oligoflexia bacterium]|nr:MAG: hypothetical protein BroJett040_19540 [Oligoflexia bacterium]
MLLPQYTITTAQWAATIAFDCRLSPTDYKTCLHFYDKYPFVDPGAATWQDIPSDYFLSDLNNQFQGEFPRWNPYIGSGYPIKYDGMHVQYSWVENIQRLDKSDSGRDLAVFLRFLMFISGIVLSLYFLNVGGSFLYWGGATAAVARYLCYYVDITFLDLDLAAPWLFALTFAVKNNIQRRYVYLVAIGLGLHLGTQGFVQSHVSFSVVTLLVGGYGLAFVNNKRLYIKAYAAMIITWSVLALPRLISFIPILDSLFSNRSANTEVLCHGAMGFGWNRFLTDLLRYGSLGDLSYIGPIGAFLLIAFMCFRSEVVRYLAGLLLIFLAWHILGFPSAVCQVPILSHVFFGRHHTAFLDALVVITVVISFSELYRQNLFQIQKKRLVYWLVVLVSILPFFHREFFNAKTYRESVRVPFAEYPSQIPESSPLSFVQVLSQTQDRRHFSPDRVFFPNWSAVFRIMDTRVLYALYPMKFYQLATGLYDGWYGELRINGKTQADRFIGPNDFRDGFHPDLQRLLILSRVSLFSFNSDKSYFPVSGPYSKCRQLGKDQLFETFLCDQISGVGYFPKEIQIYDSDEKIFNVLRQKELNDLIDFAAIKSNEPLKEAKGQVIEVLRQGHYLRYKLTVHQGGVFIIADNIFPGWKAKVNGAPAQILEAC